MPARKSIFALAISNVILVGLPGLCQAARRRTLSRLLRGDMGLLDPPKYWAQATVNNACAGDSYLDFTPDRLPPTDPDDDVDNYWVWWERGITCPDGFDLIEETGRSTFKYCRSPTIPGGETAVITINGIGTISWPGVESTADYDVTTTGEDYYLEAEVCFGWERCTGPDYSEDNAPVYEGDYLVSGRPSWYSEWNGCEKVDPSGKNKPAPPESKPSEPSKQPVPSSSDAAGAQSKPGKQPVVTGPSTNTNGTSNTTETTATTASAAAHSVGAGVVTAMMMMMMSTAV